MNCPRCGRGLRSQTSECLTFECGSIGIDECDSSYYIVDQSEECKLNVLVQPIATKIAELNAKIEAVKIMMFRLYHAAGAFSIANGHDKTQHQQDDLEYALKVIRRTTQ